MDKQSPEYDFIFLGRGEIIVQAVELEGERTDESDYIIRICFRHPLGDDKNVFIKMDLAVATDFRTSLDGAIEAVRSESK